MSEFRPIVNPSPGHQPSLVARVLAGLTGLVLLPAAALGISIAGLNIAVGAQIPNKRIPDGDPCCSHPDTWLETISWTGIGLVGVLVCVGALALDAALLWWAAKAQRLSGRRAMALGAVGVLVAFLAFASLVLTADA